MSFELSKGFHRKIFVASVIAFIFLSSSLNEVKAQEDPPRPPSIIQTIDLSFGAFYQGAGGGTVTVDELGSRSYSGNIVLLTLGGYPFSAAHFNINSNPGTIINIMNIPDFQLTWSGYSMDVHIEATNPLLPHINSNPYSVPTELTIGATLIVGDPVANPPGDYSGTFNVTLVIE